MCPPHIITCQMMDHPLCCYRESTLYAGPEASFFRSSHRKNTCLSSFFLCASTLSCSYCIEKNHPHCIYSPRRPQKPRVPRKARHPEGAEEPSSTQTSLSVLAIKR